MLDALGAELFVLQLLLLFHDNHKYLLDHDIQRLQRF